MDTAVIEEEIGIHFSILQFSMIIIYFCKTNTEVDP